MVWERIELDPCWAPGSIVPAERCYYVPARPELTAKGKARLVYRAAPGEMAGTVEEWTLRATDPAGPEGGCVGTDTHVTVGLMSCGCLVGV